MYRWMDLSVPILLQAFTIENIVAITKDRSILLFPGLLLTLPVASTLVGGLVAVRFRRYTNMLIAGGAGLLLGAAFLDLMPEAIMLAGPAGSSPAKVLSLTLVSLLLFFGIENCLDALSVRHGSRAARKSAGRVAGAMLIFHSFRDGMAIGASYVASHPAGYAVAMGIAAHDLGDGMNTVLLTTGGEKPTRTDHLFLILDAIAPLAGGLAAVWWFSSLQNSVLLLALASGFFIQMAASDFLPEVRHCKGSRRILLLLVALGAAIIYGANLLIGRWQ
ncbi:ZIP family metal transporter [Silvibacterium sp.]|uniref:ZIP family metal transporter n=1 Tax=Silvibacterium sp. TaxID=1964179 RepID=UPI0039E3FF16